MKLYNYFHWNGNSFIPRGTVRADDDLSAFEAACRKLKLLHRGNIAVQEVPKHVH